MRSFDVSGLFDAYYYAHGCGKLPYERNENWLRFFDAIAHRIITEIQPHTVLDAGCAMGFLVESLRAREVEAYGIDIAEHAIRLVHPSIQAYCRVGSVTESFPQSYNLIVCIEVLEHVPPREAEHAIANLCRHADDILFSSSPIDFKEATHFNVQPPDYWAEQFARHGFFHDVDFDASFITPWAARFRRARDPVARVMAAYERRLWQLTQENQARRELNIEQRNELAAREQTIQQTAQALATLETLRAERQALREAVKTWEKRWAQLEASPGGKLLRKLQRLRARLAPPGSSRDQMLDIVLRELLGRRRAPGRLLGRTMQVEGIQPRPPLQAHTSSAEIIICVHNALADVQRCLESIIRHTTQPYSIILVDDGSDAPTRDYLSEFARAHSAILLRNEEPRGYTRAANQGLRRSSADFVVLLNSDTVVTSEWLDRLIACAVSNPQFGIVGPLSNTASWQSIPDIEQQGDWAANPIPAGMPLEEMGALVARYSARLFPPVAFLNGFCLMIRRQVIDQIGYFDEENFGPGYGEEDDYTLRAREAGWALAIADDTYVYHAQSRSYSHEKRKQLTQQAGKLLTEKHGRQVVEAGVNQCRNDRVLEGIRARSRVMFARQEWIEKGQALFAGRRVLFVLPIAEPAGGGNVVLDEATAMRHMGVDVSIFNLESHRSEFSRVYPELEIPVLYGERKHLETWAREYDAVIATYHTSVEWLASIDHSDNRPVRGYYVQGFEPYMFAPNMDEYRTALASYTLVPDAVLFTKTEWTRHEVKRHTGAACALIGVSLNIDLFRPRPRSEPVQPDRPAKIAAMVRPHSPYREPKMTMEILRRISRRYGDRVEVVIFGTTLDNPGFSQLPQDFPWQLAGVLNQKQVAQLLTDIDILVDFSSHQAMGLTALEAMACGAAVIVPAHGGAVSFARHRVNSLVTDTSSARSCQRALQQLIEDRELRTRLQRNALIDVPEYYVEQPAFNILNALFNSQPSS